jgi:hypothetical protein
MVSLKYRKVFTEQYLLLNLVNQYVRIHKQQ